eukprot:1157531-Pelagomonas_calceolata.AAC.6
MAECLCVDACLPARLCLAVCGCMCACMCVSVASPPSPGLFQAPCISPSGSPLYTLALDEGQAVILLGYATKIEVLQTG